MTGTYTFKRTDKLYVCDLSQPPEPLRDENIVFLTTVIKVHGNCKIVWSTDGSCTLENGETYTYTF